jgi:hypothetical protein
VRLRVVALVLIAACATSRGESDAVELKLAHDSGHEHAMAAQLQRLIDHYDLSKWTFTRTVIVDENQPISHSHPVLTMSAPDRAYPDDDILAAYIHEHLHWPLEEKPAAKEAALADLRKLYPDAPKGPPEGARDQYSTYVHLIVCHLEYEAMKELVGEERARAALKKPYYRWVYRTVLAENEKIAEIVRRHGLQVSR